MSGVIAASRGVLDSSNYSCGQWVEAAGEPGSRPGARGDEKPVLAAPDPGGHS